AKGSWQVGACQHLIVERGLWFDVIAGVSAGAVNAATLAQARDPDELAAELEHLRAVWLGLRGSHDIYRRRWLGALGTVLARRASLYHAAPLHAILTRHVDPARVATSPIRLRIGYVDLLSGRYRTAGNEHPTLVDAVLAPRAATEARAPRAPRPHRPPADGCTGCSRANSSAARVSTSTRARYGGGTRTGSTPRVAWPTQPTCGSSRSCNMTCRPDAALCRSIAARSIPAGRPAQTTCDD